MSKTGRYMNELSLSRFNEFKVEGRKATCFRCEKEFVITHERTTAVHATGDGFWPISFIVDLVCPRCAATFGIGLEDLKNE